MADLIGQDESWGTVRGKLNQNLPTERPIGAGAAASQTANYAVLTELFGVPSKGRIFLDLDTYDIGNRTIALPLSNLWIKGRRGGSTLKTSAKTLLSIGDTTDNVYEDINFVSTASDTTDDSVNAVVQFLQRLALRHRFIRCTFAIPNAAANAVKLIADHPGKRTEEITFEDCHVLSAGRMGVELSNDPLSGLGAPDTVTRHFGFKWLGGSIKNTGLVSVPGYGMGLSVHGFAEDCEVDSRFDNNMFAAIENVGACNSVFTGRATNIRDTPSGTVSAALSFTGNTRLDPSRKMSDNVVHDFKADTGREIRFWNQERLTTRGNRFKLSAGTAGVGYVTYAGSTKCLSVGDQYDCDGNYVLQAKTEVASGGATANCVWEALDLDHSRASNPFQMINFMGNGTIGNIVRPSVIAPKTVSEPIVAAQPEGSIVGSIAGTTLTVTSVAAGAPPLRVGLAIDSNQLQAGTTISALDGTGTGGAGTYSVNISQTVSSGTMKTGRAERNFVLPTRTSAGYEVSSAAIVMGGDFNVDLSIDDAFPNYLVSDDISVSVQGANSLTATRQLIFGKGFGKKRITNLTAGGQAITVRQTGSAPTVSVANGSTVTIKSTPSGVVLVP